MKSFLVLYCLGFWFVAFGNGIRVEPLSLPNGQYKCYLRCLAKCFEKNEAMDKCSEQCYIYQSSTSLCKQDDTKCWNTCNNLMDVFSNFQLQIPVIKSAKYFGIPISNPRLVALEWSKVSDAILYVVQYMEFEDEFTTWANGSIRYEETTLLKATLPKENLCSKYSFRVAAVSKNSISAFSDIENLTDPIPFVSNPAIAVESQELFDTDYIDVMEKKIDNGTVRATIRYNSPIGWRQNDFVPEFTYIHLVACKKCEGRMPSFSLPTVITDQVEPLAYFDLPSFAMHCECTFSVSLSHIKSTCGSVFDYFNYSDSSNTLFNFTCENTKNSNCTVMNKILHPMCIVENFGFNISPNIHNSSFQQVTLHWKPLQQLADVPVAYWIVHFVNAKKQNLNYPTLQIEEIKDLGVVKICNHKQNETKCGLHGSIEMDVKNVFQNGLFYIVHICAVFNESTEDTINWNISARGLLDFTKDVTKRQPVINIDEQNSSSKLIIGLAIGLTLLLTVIVTGTIVYLIVRRQRLLFNQHQLTKSI